MPKPSEYQEKVRHGNRMSVLSILKNAGPVRFGDLKDSTGFSPMGLSKILKDLEKNRLIKHFLYVGRPVYEITKKGFSVLEETMTLGLFSDQIKKGGGKYFHDYSKIRQSFESKGIPWGIKDDVVMNKDLEKELVPILSKVIENFHSDVFDKFQDESKIKNIHFEKLINRKIIVGFTIDFHNLLKSIKESSFLMMQKELNLQGSKKSSRKSTMRRAKKR